MFEAGARDPLSSRDRDIIARRRAAELRLVCPLLPFVDSDRPAATNRSRGSGFPPGGANRSLECRNQNQDQDQVLAPLSDHSC